MIKKLKWLWAVSRAYDIYHSKEMLFSRREAFTRNLAPPFRDEFRPITTYHHAAIHDGRGDSWSTQWGQMTIGWPDAMFHISANDVERALMAARVHDRLRLKRASRAG